MTAATKPATPIALLRGELLELRAVDAERRRVPVRTDASAAGPVEPSPPESWRRWAACRNADTAMFFPGRGDYWSAKAAVKLCEGCVVREACLQAALAEEADAAEPAGVGGVLSAGARVRLQRQRRTG